jgi:hypothetical protein
MFGCWMERCERFRVVFEAWKTEAEGKERRYLALYSHSRILSFFASFFFLIRIPGWKNLTTVDKAIHINARERALGGMLMRLSGSVRQQGEMREGRQQKTLKKYFYVLLYALVRID